MKIHQLHVSYVNEQDRFLLRINTQDGDEMSAWLTRRLTLDLLPALTTKAAQQLRHHAGQTDPAASLEVQRQQMLENFKKEATAYEGDYTTAFQTQASTPQTGSHPLLITQVKITLLTTGQLQLQMFEKLPAQQRDLQVLVSPKLVQGLLHLLNRALKKSGWLEGGAPAASHEADSSTDTPFDSPDMLDDADRPKYLN